MIINRIRLNYIDTEGDSGYEILEVPETDVKAVHAFSGQNHTVLIVAEDVDGLSPVDVVAHVKLVSSVTAYYEAGLHVVRQPIDARGRLGETVLFSCWGAAGADELSYQWQYRRGSGTGWTNVTTIVGARTPTLHVPITESRIAYHFACLISDSQGNSIRTGECNIILIEEEAQNAKVTHQNLSASD